MKKLLTLFVLNGLMITSILAQWSTDPHVNLSINSATGEQVLPKHATCANGNTYVSWFSLENSNYNVRLQLLDVYGNKLWNDTGLLVSTHTSMSWITDYDLTVDNENCAILVFQDIRNTYNNVYAYKISPAREFLWEMMALPCRMAIILNLIPKFW